MGNDAQIRYGDWLERSRWGHFVAHTGCGLRDEGESGLPLSFPCPGEHTEAQKQFCPRRGRGPTYSTPGWSPMPLLLQPRTTAQWQWWVKAVWSQNAWQHH